MFGIKGLQERIRKVSITMTGPYLSPIQRLLIYNVNNTITFLLKDVKLAHQFEELVKADQRFEIFGEVVLGLVCFRIKVSTRPALEFITTCNTIRRFSFS